MFYGIPVTYVGVCDVQENFQHYFDLLTNKCCNLFKWEGLPDTIDEKFLMLQLVLNGRVCWTKIDGKLYALNGNVGGEPNAYYEPQTFIIANPILGSKTVRIRQKDGSSSTEGLDGVLMALTDIDYMSDRAMKGGLYRLIYQTAGLLADNISSLNVSQINGRVAQLWTVDNDAEARTVEEIVRDMYDGHPYRILTQDLVSKIGTVPAAQTGQSNTLLNLIEAHQYILASFYNEIGIPATWNMKRERVNTAETELMTGSLDISVYNMEKSLKAAVDQINELFGTSISVRFNEDIVEDEGTTGENQIGEEEPDSEPESSIETKEEAAQEEVEKKEEKEEIIKTEETDGGDEK